MTAEKLCLCQLPKPGSYVTIIGAGRTNLRSAQAGGNRKASGLFEMLDPQPKRERWRSAVFLISLGRNPLKSLDSEK
jgi:hypothetical protein